MKFVIGQLFGCVIGVRFGFRWLKILGILAKYTFESNEWAATLKFLSLKFYFSAKCSILLKSDILI